MTYIKLPRPFPEKLDPHNIPSWGHFESIKKPTKGPKSKIKFKPVKPGNASVLLHVVLDESSSMASCHKETLSGLNEWIDSQKKHDKPSSLTITKFNGDEVINIFEHKDIKDVKKITKKDYFPCGMTNLHDAIGKSIADMNASLKKYKKKSRPTPIIAIFTDGLENSSNEYTGNDIKAMVDACEKQDWTFMFLGANIDAFATGSAMGFKYDNTMQYDTSSMGATMSAFADATTRAVSGKLDGKSNSEVYANLYSDADRKKAIGEE